MSRFVLFLFVFFFACGLRAEEAPLISEAELKQYDAMVAKGEYSRAYEFMVVVLEKLEKQKKGDGYLERAEFLDEMAEMATRAGLLTEAESRLEQAVAVDRKEGKADAATRAGRLSRLASAHQRAGKHPRAVAVLEEAIALLDEKKEPVLKLALEIDLTLARRKAGQSVDAAGEIAKRIEQVIGLTGDKDPTVAAALRELGKLHAEWNRPKEAAQALGRALELNLRYEKEWAEAMAGTGEVESLLSSLARAELALGQHKEAMEHLALLKKRLPTTPSGSHISAYLLEGRILEGLKQFDEAEKAFLRAREAAEKLDKYPDYWQGHALYEGGEFLRRRGRIEEAGKLLEQAAGKSRSQFGDHHLLPNILVALSQTRKEEGDHVRAESLLREVISLDEALYPDGDPVAARHLEAWSGLLLTLGRRQEAIQVAERVAVMMEKIHGPDHAETGEALINLGIQRLFTDQHDQAETPLLRGREILTRDLGADHPRVLHLAVTMAEFHRFRGQGALSSEEEQVLRQRFRLMLEEEKGADHPLVANALVEEANVSVSLPAPEREKLYVRAETLLEKAFSPTHTKLLYPLSLHAAFLETENRLPEALSVRRRESAIRKKDFFSSSSSGNPGHVERGVESRGKPFRLHLDLLARVVAGQSEKERQNLGREAMGIVQWLQAAGTARAVAAMAARFAQGNDALAGELVRQRLLAARYRQLDQDLLAGLGEAGKGASAELIREIKQVEEELTALDVRLQKEYPRYAELVGRMEVPSEEILALLAPGEAVLAVSSLPKQTVLLLVKREGVTLLSMPGGEELIGEKVTRVRESLQVGENGKPLPFAAREAHDLYKLLLAPLEKALAGVNHLLFIPDGSLGSLPLALLPTAPPDAVKQGEALPWLVRKMAISTLPSLSSLAGLRGHAAPSRADRPFLGIGDPLLGGKGAKPGATLRSVRPVALFRKDGGVDPEALQSLDPLPETAVELEKMARSLAADPGETLFLRERARESVVREIPMEHYRVIAFATHGAVAGELDGLSEPALVLTPPLAGDDRDDGLFTASEVARRQLDADWVLLSACNTAAPGGEPGAEGLSGLAKAFFHAGARSLLVSHWAVVSEATVLLTTHMLQSGGKVGKAEALRQAELAVMSDQSFSHPLFWAPFVVVGGE